MRSEAQPDKGRASLQQERGDGVSRPPLLPSASARWWENRSAEPRRAGRALRGPARQGARIFAAREGGRRQPSPLLSSASARWRKNRSAEPRRAGRALRGPAREGAGIAPRAFAAGEGDGVSRPPLLPSAPARRWKNRSAEPRRAGRALRGPARQGRASLQQERGTALAVPRSCRLRPRGGGRTAPRTPAGRACAPRPCPTRGAHLCSRRGGRRQPSPSLVVCVRAAVEEPQRGTPAGRACAPRPSPRRVAHLCSKRGDGVSRPLSCHPPPRGARGKTR